MPANTEARCVFIVMFPVVFLFLVEAVTPNAALFSFSSLNNLRASVYTAVSAEREDSHTQKSLLYQTNTTPLKPLLSESERM